MRSISSALVGLTLLAGLSATAGAQTPAPTTTPSTESSPSTAPTVPALPNAVVPASPPVAPPPIAPPPALTPIGPATAPPPAAPAPAAAAAPPSGPYYIVTYFNIAAKGARKATALLAPFAAATRKADGNTELTVLHEIGRPGRFAIVEAWKDKTAADAHGAAMKALGDKLQPIFTAPFSARPFLVVDVAATAPNPNGDANLAGAVWVLTHIDVFPAGKDEVAGMVKQLVADSRKDAGEQRFDAIVWDGHANHLHLIEAWSDRKALEAHAGTEHTRTFRAKLVPFEGGLYDERLYEVVKKTE